MADHDVLNGDQGEEEHESDNVIAANHKLSEGFNDAPGRGHAFIAVQQNAAAGSQVERKTKEGEQKQQAGEDGKLRRAQNLKGR